MSSWLNRAYLNRTMNLIYANAQAETQWGRLRADAWRDFAAFVENDPVISRLKGDADFDAIALAGFSQNYPNYIYTGDPVTSFDSGDVLTITSFSLLKAVYRNASFPFAALNRKLDELGREYETWIEKCKAEPNATPSATLIDKAVALARIMRQA